MSIGNIPPILERIFAHLPISSLNKCACVCKLWNSMVKVEKRKRPAGAFWMCKLVDHYGHDCFEEGSSVCSEAKLDVGSHFHEVLLSVKFHNQSKLGIMFISNGIEENPHEYFRDCAKVEPIENGPENLTPFSGPYLFSPPTHYKPFLEYISRYLPRDCNMIILRAMGMVATSADGSEINKVDGFSSFFLPAAPGLETFQFLYTKISEKLCNEDDISTITGIPKDKELKCLLLFPSFGDNKYDLLLKHYLKKQDYRLAVGGGRVPRVVSPQKTDTKPHQVTVGLAFAGEGIEVASILLHGTEEPEIMYGKFQEIKTSQDSGKCFAFLLSHSANDPISQEAVVAFRRVFPRAPLFGVELSIAFGNTFYSGSNPEMDNDFHEMYNLVFIILSLC